jgi:hypothetical protein
MTSNKPAITTMHEHKYKQLANKDKYKHTMLHKRSPDKTDLSTPTINTSIRKTGRTTWVSHHESPKRKKENKRL